MSTSLTARLRDLCDEVIAALEQGPERAGVEQVRDRLSQPLRLAVAGPVSSGKSTLVNALLGQQVAPVGAGETTRVVTWYRYGVEDRAVVLLRDGRTLPLLMDGGRVPRDLGQRPADVEHVVVELSNQRLRNLQIVDTPGLNTTSDHLELTTRRLLGTDDRTEDDATRSAVGEVDAVVFLLPDVRSRDMEVLEAVGRLFSGTPLSGLNVVGVLSRIDRLADDGDPWPAAHTIAGRLQEQLHSSVATVTPVIGLLAETVACGLFTERDADALRQVAHLGAESRADVLVDATEFLSSPEISLDRATRRHLFDRLGLYGLGLATRAVDEGARDAAALLRVLEASSGFDKLVDTLERRVLSHADLLAAHIATAQLRRLSYLGGSGAGARVLGSLRDPLERVELDSQMHRLRLLECLAQMYREELHFPPDRRADLERLALGEGPAGRLGLEPDADDEQVVAAALDAASTWVAVSNDPRRSPTERAAARAIRTALELMVTETSTPAMSPDQAAS